MQKKHFINQTTIHDKNFQQVRNRELLQLDKEHVQKNPMTYIILNDESKTK